MPISNKVPNYCVYGIAYIHTMNKVQLVARKVSIKCQITYMVLEYIHSAKINKNH